MDINRENGEIAPAGLLVALQNVDSIECVVRKVTKSCGIAIWEMRIERGSYMITIDSKHICIAGHIGKWYAIGERDTEQHGKLFLLEHETFGDDALCLIVNESGKVIVEDVQNGFRDYEERLADQTEKR